jgi:uncharacterized protein (TIGR02444 family)
MVSTLWDFASDCYSRPGMAEICLRAQDDYAADINMVLTAAWLAARTVRWECADVAALAQLCTEWRTQCLLPLRSVRRYLKHRTGADDMYTRVKMLELDAERRQLQLIETVLSEHNTSGTDDSSLLRHNLDTYFSTLPSFERIDTELIETLAAALKPGAALQQSGNK